MRLRWTLPFLTLTLTIGCATAMPTRRATPADARAVALLAVTNNHFEDLVVYWRKGDVDVALGVVGGLTERRFGVPPALLGDGLNVRLSAGRRGQRSTLVSPAFDAGHRATISWILDYQAAGCGGHSVMSAGGEDWLSGRFAATGVGARHEEPAQVCSKPLLHSSTTQRQLFVRTRQP
jgi:hypothetical protein